MKTIVLSFLILFSLQTFGQKAKELRKYNIKTKSVEKTIEKDGEKITFIETEEIYNKNGKILSKIEYSRNGEVKKKNIYKYDGFGNVIEEEEYDAKKENHFFYKYSYNADGKKISQLKSDIDGKLIEKSVYSYDRRGLRTEKKEFDAKGEFKSIRKISYEYFK
ncbi:MAG: hypothetical protein M0Q45_06710 [Bacteroidales bacterium]|jgi:hypothetical protein|nr:hypothetical protein [Bacteroidales bacterium]MCK9499179.1 hypothetical protein [Bacteroidales bacterium]MDY0314444.1 hypothetical protein [Bacteroidales bacterium]